MSFLLETKNLTKYYGKRLAIDKVSITVSPGEIVGFVGPNGSGKTTTMRTVMGFLKPDSGKVFLFGEEVNRRNVHRLLRYVGYVPGEVNYYADVTVRRILEFYTSFYEDFDAEYCEYLCKMFDVQLDKKFEELSLGNKKKVSIIQALAHKPRLLILDEPTNSLDPVIQKKLYNILRELRASGVGVLLSSHVLGEVEKLCDRVVFIKDGRIVTPPTFDKSMKKIVVDLSTEQVEQLSRVKADFPEVVELILENSTVVIYFKGSQKRLVHLLNSIDFQDISVTDLSLEDVFENLYRAN
ncbi:ABC transporter ATP-binding protein [Fervidobacterium thailandense]|uniref:ABC transporter domain-containing protein n=1 Tax=Fervidobacterium thailandense TaxID=1008305 RepID=A0A1E3G0N2_9BACT|nr:ABC transporter ATP-binding protein [Fervidobacterium thailandense]ODN29799.1 hypothetical protein A4H02_08875 [Fervidobacterium thailandense]